MALAHRKLSPLAAVLIFFSALISMGLAVALALPRLGVFAGLMLIILWATAMLFLSALLLIATGGREGSEAYLLEAPLPQGIPLLLGE